MRLTRVGLCLWLATFAIGCAPLRLLTYALAPDYPRLQDGAVLTLHGLREEVRVTRKADGLWKIAAANEHDAMLAQGYLTARDRMAQMDLFRHLARGEIASLIGNQPFGDKTAVDTDRLNRFLGFRDGAERLYAATSAEERAALDAFVLGINLWIDNGTLSLEHRLLGIQKLRPWTPLDSLAIYQMIMHALGGNADREVRRLVIACEAGLDAVDRIWPHDIEFDALVLPDDDLRRDVFPPQPAVVEELRTELPALCEQGRNDRYAARACPDDQLRLCDRFAARRLEQQQQLGGGGNAHGLRQTDPVERPASAAHEPADGLGRGCGVRRTSHCRLHLGGVAPRRLRAQRARRMGGDHQPRGPAGPGCSPGTKRAA